ncbi:hypothetical protein [Mesorhizobium sp. WSM4313]|uniref:hypothetical protein n=1 Tax=Mesorhizobium sp. WSM4313 TaxID=2029412 RepID=UPI000BB0210B|nr:hypothetical protein [Mesorhizobium sp. WSM4313]PBB20558.1 hypothetical protein CK219_05320 [Mesorhizobium sp. WSM4313]
MDADSPGPEWSRLETLPGEEPEDAVRRMQPPPLSFEEQLAVEVDIVRQEFGRDPRPVEMNALIRLVKRRNGITHQ